MANLSEKESLVQNLKFVIRETEDEINELYEKKAILKRKVVDAEFELEEAKKDLKMIDIEIQQLWSYLRSKEKELQHL